MLLIFLTLCYKSARATAATTSGSCTFNLFVLKDVHHSTLLKISIFWRMFMFMHNFGLWSCCSLSNSLKIMYSHLSSVCMQKRQCRDCILCTGAVVTVACLRFPQFDHWMCVENISRDCFSYMQPFILTSHDVCIAVLALCVFAFQSYCKFIGLFAHYLVIIRYRCFFASWHSLSFALIPH